MDNILKEIGVIIKGRDEFLANRLFEQYHVVDILEELEDLSDENLFKFLRLCKDVNVAEIFEVCDEEFAVRISKSFNDFQLIEIFSHMKNSDVADLLGYLPTVRRKEILKIMKTSDSNILKMILSFDEDTAGGIMSTNFISLRENLTAQDALNKIKQISPETEIIDEIFITDYMHRLKGYVTLRTILTADDEDLLKDLYEQLNFYVYGRDDQEIAANLFTKYDLTVLPVLNQNKAILGVITSEDIIPVIEDELNEDMLAMHGVGNEDLDSGIVKSVKSRLPWLIINLLTAFLASSVVKQFEPTISKVVVLSVAMPIVTGMGGNSGSQTLSIVLTSLARGEVSLKEDFNLIMKEIILGFLQGAVIGIITAGIFTMWSNNIYLAIILFLSMIGNMIIAGITGFLIPLLLDKFNIDPAVASSIFLTTFTDTCGFFIFLGLATIFLRYLV